MPIKIVIKKVLQQLSITNNFNSNNKFINKIGLLVVYTYVIYTHYFSKIFFCIFFNSSSNLIIKTLSSQLVLVIKHLFFINIIYVYIIAIVDTIQCLIKDNVRNTLKDVTIT